ncbi:hypothetical protein CLPUN_44990 [Clostridium puniceum]|uniref:Uncharacterized protein n=1 Tax=Clostridium puniceum TaxID=29367 RepID=A0A1S8T7G7_9CLOT|nr:hypothetical protein [Clostridium puniceum]OOM73531.1 hypothetical protein CLPUN_44990 [Clostridium puniceum]
MLVRKVFNFLTNITFYLTTVVKHFNDEWGTTFNTINPMNEPSTNYWKKGGNQEGCDFNSPEEKNNILDL